MPELPEVETIVRSLREWLIGETVRGVEVYWPRSVATPGPEAFESRLLGQRILGVERRGKFVVLRLERGNLLVHLRMTGQLILTPAGEPTPCQHVRVALSLDGKRLLFNDSRKFGRLYLVDEIGEVVGGLGPEPLEPGFTEAELQARLCRRRVAIKSLLLDQRFLAGVGNIYADEALHTAGIAPQRQACTLSHAEVAALHSAIRAELERAIRGRGTTLSNYRDAEGREGGHREHLRVYGRAGLPCRRCGAEIARARIGGRSSFHCPRCQK